MATQQDLKRKKRKYSASNVVIRIDTHCFSNKKEITKILRNTVAVDNTPKPQNNNKNNLGTVFSNKDINDVHNERVYDSMCFTTAQANVLLEETLPEEILKRIRSHSIIGAKKYRPQKLIDNTKQNVCTSLVSTVPLNATTTSERDIQLLLNIIKILFATIGDRKKQNNTIYIQNNDEPKYKRLLSLQYDKKKMIEYIPHKPKTQDSVCFPKDQLLGSSTFMRTLKALDISVDRRCISYKISICKFNSFSLTFLKTLAFLGNLARVYQESDVSNSVSVNKSGWHVRSIAQGYLLMILLKNLNITSLNFLRKLYFVIITSETQNVIVEINIKLTNDSYIKPYKTESVYGIHHEISSYKLTEWNKEHRSIIDQSLTVNTPIDAIARIVSEPDELDGTISLSNSSYYFDSDCASNQDSSSTLKCPTTVDIDDDKETISFSESDSFYSNSSDGSDVQIKESIITLQLPMNIGSANNVFDLRKACGDTNLTSAPREIHSSCCSRKKNLRKTWYSKLVNDCLILKADLGIPILRYGSLINETVFERIMLDNYLNDIAQKWAQLRENGWNVNLRSLGLNIVNSLFETVIGL